MRCGCSCVWLGGCLLAQCKSEGIFFFLAFYRPHISSPYHTIFCSVVSLLFSVASIGANMLLRSMKIKHQITACITRQVQVSMPEVTCGRIAALCQWVYLKYLGTVTATHETSHSLHSLIDVLLMYSSTRCSGESQSLLFLSASYLSIRAFHSLMLLN